VAILAINADKAAPQSLAIPAGAERYTLTARNLLDPSVELNGTELKLGAEDALPELKGKPVHAGQATFAPESITFLAFPTANNASCQY
jgi:hypothetical protein